MLEASNASSIYCIVLRFGKWVLQVVIFYFRRILWCRPRILHRWIPWEFSEVQKGCPKEYAAQQGGKKSTELMKHMKIHINLVIDSGEMQD